MKYSKVYIAIFSIASLMLVSCEYDNFDAPTSTLSGRIVHEGSPVGVRTRGTRLELWEDGHILRTPMDVHISHDGLFSASLFDGTYKLVRKGEAPWLPQSTDTIVVTVQGHTQMDFPVTPYFTIQNDTYTSSGNTLQAQFTIRRVVPEANVSNVVLYVGRSILTDQNLFAQRVELPAGSIQLGQPTSISTELPASLAELDYVFVRIGVRSNLSGEYYYSQVQRFNLR